MSDPSIEITASPPLESLGRALEAELAPPADLSGPHREAAEFLQRWVRRNFQSEGGLVGGWAPLAASTRKARAGGADAGKPILQGSGRLRRSFVPFSSAGGAGIGSALPYAARHHLGLGLPRRRLLPLADEVRPDLGAIVRAQVEKIRAAFGRAFGGGAS